ncbi:MAG: hypothetical protein K2H44_04515 [Muribaculaceae bacterium]|nr:hypothetical protein [Muribaculaceae bacterium]
MKRNNLYLLLVASLAFTFASCGEGENVLNPVPDENENNEDVVIKDNNDDSNPSRVIELNDIESDIADMQLDFACNFFKEAAKERANKNFVISPLSAYVDLSMIANGAKGKTASELISVLAGDKASIREVNDFNKRLNSELVSLDKTTILQLANSVWYSDKIDIDSSYVNVCKEYYNAQSTKGDFLSEALLNQMNNWLSDATKGLITSFKLGDLSQTKAVIANALYFNGKWASPFAPKDTKDDKFTNSDGSVSTVKMMHGKKYNYLKLGEENGKFVIVEIPYGNSSYSFYAVFSVDENDVTLSGVENVINSKNINRVRAQMRYGDSYIEIPRFDVSSLGDISSYLEGLGVKELFDNPDLSGISKTSFDKLGIMQESVIKVEETRTEGAAATYDFIITAKPGSVQTKQPFTVDRPFVFLVMEKSVGTILFIGEINKL